MKEGVVMKKIKVEPYSTKWAHGYIAIRDAYFKHVSGNFKVTHVGSTSVPGLASRGVIDIDIVVTHKGDLIDLVSQLNYLGYLNVYESEDQSVIFFKRSIREVPLLKEHHSKWLPHHLNLCLEDSVFYKAHLSFRDYMMTHEKEIESYSALKNALSHKYPKDVEAYQKEKYNYIHEVLRSEGFTDEEIDLLKTYEYT